MHPWRWPQGPDDSWPGLCRAVLGVGHRPWVAAGSQEVRLHHPLQLLAATHSIDARHKVELLRDKKWRMRSVWIKGLLVDRSYSAIHSNGPERQLGSHRDWMTNPDKS